MRLLNTSTLEFRSFQHTACPSYAVLSHRWGAEDDEPTHQDYLASQLPKSTGHRKILDFCITARSLGYKWGWVDTVCIDKKSSAELTEAINSMFTWYGRSACCLVYLDDVEADYSNQLSCPGGLQHSAWFTRGWTLQELLAPTHVIFFDKHWSLLGSVSDGDPREFDTKQLLRVLQVGASLTEIVSMITGITRQCLVFPSSVRHTSIARRMSWASKRRTTREEDIAYSLLGLFSVNMPLLYGEGGVRAFQRLQREIIENSNDESIFAWNSSALQSHSNHVLGRDPRQDFLHVGPLARSPAAFQNSSTIKRWNVKESLKWPPYKMTNRGLKLIRPSWHMDSADTWAFNAFPALRNVTAEGKNVRLIRLACVDSPVSRVGSMDCHILIVQDSAISETNQWFRVMPAAGKSLIVDRHCLKGKTEFEQQLFYIGSFLELGDHGPSVDWSIRRR